ncbi:MAG: acyl-CoA dehydrogenase family protein [Polyangiales bacterium]
MSQTNTSPESPDLDAVRRSIRAICQRYDLDYWRKVDSARAYPTEFMATVAEAGYFGTLISPAYGGLGLGPGVASVVVEEINRAGGDGPSERADGHLGAVERAGTEAQKQRPPASRRASAGFSPWPRRSPTAAPT